jgi:HEXXH motif-containing protein
MMDPAYLLWEDTAAHRRRFEKSASALIAVQRALGRDTRLPGATEFLALYESAARAQPKHFTRIWRDPLAYHWVRRAVHLLASCRGAPLSGFERAYCTALGADDPAEALRIHLGEFAKFVLGLGLVAGDDVVLPTPYESVLPLALPGTELALTGSGRTSIRGLSEGGIEVVHDGSRLRLARDACTPPGRPRLESCPTVTVGDAHVVLNPHVFQLPGLDLRRGLAESTLDGQQRHADIAAEALRTLERFQPSAFSHLADTVRIIALKQARESDFGTLSNSELPGAFICSVPSDPYALAADFIHELYHNRLFAIEETGPFFAAGGEDAIEGEIHYSPWRDAPRPLHGLLHAVYVYLPVFQFWSTTLRAGVHEGARLDHVRDQLARIPFQLRIGVNQLRRSARFTPLGSALFEAMARAAARTVEDAAELGATLDVPSVTLRASGAFRPVVRERGGEPLAVAEALLDHLARWDRRGECREERDLLEHFVRRRRTVAPG